MEDNIELVTFAKLESIFMLSRYGEELCEISKENVRLEIMRIC